MTNEKMSYNSLAPTAVDAYESTFLFICVFLKQCFYDFVSWTHVPLSHIRYECLPRYMDCSSSVLSFYNRARHNALLNRIDNEFSALVSEFHCFTYTHVPFVHYHHPLLKELINKVLLTLASDLRRFSSDVYARAIDV